MLSSGLLKEIRILNIWLCLTVSSKYIVSSMDGNHQYFSPYFITYNYLVRPSEFKKKTKNKKPLQSNVTPFTKVREENLKLCDQLIHNSLIGWWWNYRAIVVSLLKLLQAWGLCAHGHQEVSFFHLVEVLASVKLKQKTKILFAEPKIEFYKLTVTQAKFMLKCWGSL